MILSTAYLGNVQYYAKLLSGKAVIDLYEHYRKQSYRNRCDILTANGTGPLIVPVLQPSGIKKPTRDIRIDSSKKWQHQHWQAIVSAYRSSPYFVHYEERFATFYRRRYDFLVDLNAELQQTVLDLLRMKPRIAYSESYVQNPDPAEDFRDALSPKPRLQRPDPAFRAAPYYQVFTERYPFAANLSIIDLLFCEGPDSTGILRNSTVR